MNAIRRSFLFPVGAAAVLALWSAPAFAITAVQVECFGDCGTVNLGQICGSLGAPKAIACDTTMTPPPSQVRFPCGINGATCIPFGDMLTTDPLSAYCTDSLGVGNGPDALVTCF